MNGLRLAEMEFSDMLDVIHYFLEDDMNYSTAEQAEARDKTRISIYNELYQSHYKYAADSSRNTVATMDFDEERVEEEEMPQPFNPAQRPKGYVPPTPMNAESAMPFGKLLDAPLEH